MVISKTLGAFDLIYLWFMLTIMQNGSSKDIPLSADDGQIIKALEEND
jgi:hypothetical protein